MIAKKLSSQTIGNWRADRTDSRRRRLVLIVPGDGALGPSAIHGLVRIDDHRAWHSGRDDIFSNIQRQRNDMAHVARCD